MIFTDKCSKEKAALNTVKITQNSVETFNCYSEGAVYRRCDTQDEFREYCVNDGMFCYCLVSRAQLPADV